MHEGPCRHLDDRGPCHFPAVLAFDVMFEGNAKENAIVHFSGESWGEVGRCVPLNPTLIVGSFFFYLPHLLISSAKGICHGTNIRMLFCCSCPTACQGLLLLAHFAAAPA